MKPIKTTENNIGQYKIEWKDSSDGRSIYANIKQKNLTPLPEDDALEKAFEQALIEDSDNDNDGTGADNNIRTGEVIKNNNNNNNGSSSSSTTFAATTTTTTAKTGNRIQKEPEEKDPGGITTRIIQEPIEQKQPEGPRMIAATFKCPKNKTPGDVIEVVNPHQLGQKIKVTIPKGTKPKKQFRVLVPLPGKKKEILPSCCICTKALPKKDEDTHKIRAPLRVCDHLCCNSCHALIGGKICPKCSIFVPKHDTFKLLPFVQQLDNSESM